VGLPGACPVYLTQPRESAPIKNLQAFKQPNRLDPCQRSQNQARHSAREEARRSRAIGTQRLRRSFSQAESSSESMNFWR